MFVLNGEIEIGKYRFRTIHAVEITKSVDELGSTAVIQLPTRFRIRQNGKELYTEEAIKPGDQVKITLGYEKEYTGVEFLGYVKKLSPKIPIEVHCEDNMWLLRQKNITKAWNNGTKLAEVLQEVVKDTNVELMENIPEIPLEKWIVKNANGAQVLQKLKEKLGLTAFINDDGKLYVGLRQGTNIGQEVKYDLNYNLVENNLEFKRAEERKVRIRYTYIAPNNKRTTVEVGDKNGGLRTFYTSVVKDEVKLKELAEAQIGKLKYDGYDGSVESFLVPYATRGMAAIIVDKEHPNRNGKYFITKTVISFSTNGARRNVSLGTKL